jgi:hypothetical protein
MEGRRRWKGKEEEEEVKSSYQVFSLIMWSLPVD